MLHDYDQCYVIHAIFVLYNGKCSFHRPFLRYGDLYKSDLLLMVSQRALLCVSNYCHEALKCILLYLVIIKNSHIKNEFRSLSAAKRTKFDADNLLSEEDNESKLEDLEAEMKSNRQEWIRSSQPSVSNVLESFPLLQKKEYVILMYCSDTLMFVL